MNGDPHLYKILNDLKIDFSYDEHPPAPTIEIAKKYWKDLDARHCKNLFFRNHKGNKHYLVILDHNQDMSIHDLEKILRQGKLTFASEQRMMKYLAINPGSVSPFGLINDITHHVYLFIDENLQSAERISFHPNINTATLTVAFPDFIRFLEWTKNGFEFVRLY
ncbi:MAG: prolyl-tRNA synthetase associated domain-containing protein [Bacteroidota bacterium]